MIRCCHVKFAFKKSNSYKIITTFGGIIVFNIGSANHCSESINGKLASFHLYSIVRLYSILFIVWVRTGSGESLKATIRLFLCTFILLSKLSRELMSSPSLQACRQEMTFWLSIFPGRMVSPDKLPRKYWVNRGLVTSPPASTNINISIHIKTFCIRKTLIFTLFWRKL